MEYMESQMQNLIEGGIQEQEKIQVGDKIFDKKWKVSARITEVTPRGFKYKLDEPLFLGARMARRRKAKFTKAG